MAEQKGPTPKVGDKIVIPPEEEDAQPGEGTIEEVGDFDEDDDTWNVMTEDGWTWVYWEESDSTWVEMS